jgi:hypothetical protein
VHPRDARDFVHVVGDWTRPICRRTSRPSSLKTGHWACSRKNPSSRR